MARFSRKGEDSWSNAGSVVCHGWLEKQKLDRSQSEPRYVVLRSNGLLGWYQQRPAELGSETPLGVPRCWAYISRASVQKLQLSASALERFPIFALQIREKDSDEKARAPLLLFGCDDESLIQDWHRELLAVGHTAALSHEAFVPWSERGGGYVSESASDGASRAIVSAGEYVSQAGQITGAWVDETCTSVGAWSGSKVARLCSLPDEQEAERMGGKAGHMVGGFVSLALQVPGAAFRQVGRVAGGASHPSFSRSCRGQSHDRIDSDCETDAIAICSCAGCSAPGIANRGCRRCMLHLCEICWRAHTQAPVLEKPAGAYAALAPKDRKAVDAVIRSQVEKEESEKRKHLTGLRHKLEGIALALPALSSIQAYKAPEPQDCRLRNWPANRNYSFTPVRNADVLRGLSECLKTDPGKLKRKGRDVGEAPQHTSLELTAAWELKHEVLWKKYIQAAEEVASHRNQLPGSTPQIVMRNEAMSGDTHLQDWAVALGMPLRQDINEKLLGHGTKRQLVLPLVSNGLNERYCSAEAKFGKGVYLAEDVGKNDQYCEEDDGADSDPESQEFYKQVYSDCGLRHPCSDDSATDPGPGVCYVLICRAILGTVIQSKDGETCQQTGQPLWVDPSLKQELRAVPDSIPPHPYHSLVMEAKERAFAEGYVLYRYREIIIYHGTRVYPQYLIAYRRRRDGPE
eukprot:TRINITY_DN8983_c0_g1_i1.p1 TRINITY_DN8983_c0_g1~~TRINITY_DN8983_c0_g1_i1.p1  ORF type:complete len:688 (-),score=83.20 TRINITY_DN8983_c0_g1_i1:298-2361(-)